jgi:hypothetical protein
VLSCKILSTDTAYVPANKGNAGIQGLTLPLTTIFQSDDVRWCDVLKNLVLRLASSTMPTLAKKFFKATGELPLEYAARLETAGLGLPIHQTLIDQGWTGKLVAGVGLELSPDNKQVRRGEFFLRGLPTKEFIEIQARLGRSDLPVSDPRKRTRRSAGPTDRPGFAFPHGRDHEDGQEADRVHQAEGAGAAVEEGAVRRGRAGARANHHLAHSAETSSTNR